MSKKDTSKDNENNKAIEFNQIIIISVGRSKLAIAKQESGKGG